MPKRVVLLLTLVLCLLPALVNAAEPSASSLDKRRKALNDLIAEQWEYTLRTAPEYASILGDKRYNNLSSDVSAAAARRDYEQTKKFLHRFEAIDAAGFSEQERLNKVLMVKNLRDSIESFGWKEWEMPINQMGGIHLFAAQLPSYLTFTTAKDYDDYLARMHNFPKQMDDTIAILRMGMHDKLMPPKFLLQKVAAQASSIADTPVDESAFAAPIKKFPASVSDADQARIKAAFTDAIQNAIYPAYRKFAAFVKNEYAPAGRTEVGMWSLPHGAERYAFRARQSTTTKLTPDQIHQIGLREVARIEGEMLTIAKSQGFNDLKSFNASIEKNPDLRAKSREQILDIYRHYEDQMYAKLPQLFGRLPKAKLEVVAIGAYREKEAAGADYDPGAADGSRPGRINVNTYDATNRKTITMESTAYHEGVPGHHMQLSIAQELTDLPQFRRQGGYTAFVEGWALYSEKLGKEVGFYQNPFNDYGRLQDEMLRAIRLVVDTGLHSKKWTRQQVVDYFHGHSAQDEVEVQNETDRYIVWPGQALGYKIGSLEITELRERARKALGDRFDIRAFHDEVLGAGALPLDVLEQRIDAWIGKQEKVSEK
ncbi:MAG TPA: DUF885 domain-containing protein [Thermoanaerobaculia bacterium]|nr:DUF885 domain-containing protein [Thermoanaerobaculia bacterium]